MILIPITLLALAAGIYLLVHIKQAGIGGLYKYLAWLVVVLSLLFIVCAIVRGARHHHHMRECYASGQCKMSGHEGGTCCPYMKGGSCSMQGGHGECTKGAESCSKEKEGDAPCCKKDGEASKAACCTKGTDGAKPACCAKTSADSATVKKK